MPEREQIGPQQLTALLLGHLLGSNLVIPSGTQAGRDAWLAALAGGTVGLGLALVYTSLARRFPDQSLMGYSKQLLGRWLGGLVGLLYLWYALHLGALVLRNFADFLLSTILSGTPISVPMLTLMLLAAYGVRHGLEPLARSSFILVTLVLFQIVLVTALLAKDIRLEQLLPVMEKGPVPILLGAFSFATFPFGEIVLYSQIFPHVRPLPQLRRSVLFTILASALLLAALNVLNPAVIGEQAALTHRFPALGVIEMIDVGEFITRLDALLIASWVAAGFVKFGACLYITSRGLADWLGLPDYRPLVLAMGTTMVALATLVYSNISEMSTFAQVTWPGYSVPFQILMPLLLLGVAWVRRLPGKKKEARP